MEGFEGVREDGKDEREAWRSRALWLLPVVPLVGGRYMRVEAMVILDLGVQVMAWEMRRRAPRGKP